MAPQIKIRPGYSLMKPWEKRLNDLSHLLTSTGDNYFEPNLFRLNLNQFLQTSRTVTFLIQKNKSEIPNFDKWYQAEVLNRWLNDPIMTWAKDSRNAIEKEGDLDMFSSVEATLLYSYIEAQDLVLSSTSDQLLPLNIEKLIRFAEKNIPTAFRDATAIEIKRKWIANTLKDVELSSALTYIYARIYEACHSLSTHLSKSFPDEIPEPTQLDSLSNDIEQIRIIKLNDPSLGKLSTVRTKVDKAFKVPPIFKQLHEELKSLPPAENIKDQVTLCAKSAKVMFEHHTSHIPMLFLYDENWKLIDFLSTYFSDQTDKFIFFRQIANRAFYLKAYAAVWVSEAWIRDAGQRLSKPIRELEIIGERLQVIGVDVNGNRESLSWEIDRSIPSQPTLIEVATKDNAGLEGQAFFFEPILKKMKAARSK